MVKVAVLAGGPEALQTYGPGAIVEATVRRLRPQAHDVCVAAGHKDSPTAQRLALLDVNLIFEDAACCGMGALGAVFAALKDARAAREDCLITVPADMPDVPDDLVEQLCAFRSDPAEVTFFSGRSDHHLCALWKVSVLRELHGVVTQASGRDLPSIEDFLANLWVRKIKVEDEQAFRRYRPRRDPDDQAGGTRVRDQSAARHSKVSSRR